METAAVKRPAEEAAPGDDVSDSAREGRVWGEQREKTRGREREAKKGDD